MTQPSPVFFYLVQIPGALSSVVWCSGPSPVFFDLVQILTLRRKKKQIISPERNVATEVALRAAHSPEHAAPRSQVTAPGLRFATIRDWAKAPSTRCSHAPLPRLKSADVDGRLPGHYTFSGAAINNPLVKSANHLRPSLAPL
jgi:hypothetical protein